MAWILDVVALVDGRRRRLDRSCCEAAVNRASSRDFTIVHKTLDEPAEPDQLAAGHVLGDARVTRVGRCRDAVVGVVVRLQISDDSAVRICCRRRRRWGRWRSPWERRRCPVSAPTRSWSDCDNANQCDETHASRAKHCAPANIPTGPPDVRLRARSARPPGFHHHLLRLTTRCLGYRGYAGTRRLNRADGPLPASRTTAAWSLHLSGPRGPRAQRESRIAVNGAVVQSRSVRASCPDTFALARSIRQNQLEDGAKGLSIRSRHRNGCERSVR